MRVRDILETDSERLARRPGGGDPSDLVGKLAIRRSEALAIWEAIGLREQGFRVPGGNCALTPEEGGGKA